jgi:hypothetical protein
MPKIRIVTKNADRPTEDANVPAHIDLPTNYMADYSVLGLQVDDLSQAIKVLRDCGMQVAARTHSAELTFTGRPLSQIVSLLKQAGLDGCMTDLVRQVYQG